MLKYPKLDVSKYKNWAQLNPISKLYVNKIQDTILSLDSFDAKIYPQESTFSPYDYRILAKQLAKEWISKWLEIFQYHIVSVVDDLMPNIKSQIHQVEGLDKDYVDKLILSTIETEYFSMFLELVKKYLDEIQIYRLMDELEKSFTHLSKGFKVEKNVNIYPVDAGLIMGCVYRVTILNNEKFNVELYVKSKCFNFKNVSSEKDIQDEIKEKVKEFINIKEV